MSTSTSNIRVFVQWSEQTMFAGEDIECQITFKNVTNSTTDSRNCSLQFQNGTNTSTERSRKASPLQPASPQLRTTGLPNTRRPQINRGHRSTLSLNILPGEAQFHRHLESRKDDQAKIGVEQPHRRSVSIISLAHSENIADEVGSQGSFGIGLKRPSRGHARAASLQIMPRRFNGSAGPGTAPLSQRSTVASSPFVHSTSLSGPRHGQMPPESRNKRTVGIVTAPSTPSLSDRSPELKRDAQPFPLGFKFPAIDMVHELSTKKPGSRATGCVGLDAISSSNQILNPNPRDDVPLIVEQTSLPTRIISSNVNGGTPRSSGEFYSLSNNSTETLVSEYLPQHQGHGLLLAGHARRTSAFNPINHSSPPETLMMGYAQVSGSFSVDGSLINQAPFEEVKRKGVLGGQGGGVIGLETTKRDSGLLKGFGWANIGESLSGILGGGELSSMKDMRGTANSKSIPLLSTPQSILFVDLRIAPGEAASYRYTFKLPRGLPPSHRGKAIKISYSLVIGVQRPGGSREQQVKSVAIPFRVLGSVNSHGELLGHNLMAPYIILRDQAVVQKLDNDFSGDTTTSYGHMMPAKGRKPSQSTLDSFLMYIDGLLRDSHQDSSAGLLSPTELPASRRPSTLEEPTTVKEAIDMAIMKSNIATNAHRSANRFEIARNGQRVAVVMLARPAYRLGETITAAIEFTGARIPCYAIHASLETCERVDHSISLRSDASIHRVTRKIHSSHSESTLFARRVNFSSTIPVQATPSFITSGVSLEWNIIIEFVTARFNESEGESHDPSFDLLEASSNDERGVIVAAVERLDCESFEIAVPVQVFGALSGGVEKDSISEGLAV